MKAALEDESYVEHFNFDLRSILLLVASSICATFSIAMLVVADESSALGQYIVYLVMSAGVLLFGGGGLLMLYTALSGYVAFRVDANGITLGEPPIWQWGMRQKLRVPWDAIGSVVLFQQRVPTRFGSSVWRCKGCTTCGISFTGFRA